MTTKELITANIIQDITKSGNLTYFDDIVTRIYNWLYSLGFEVACNQYTLTDDTYQRVYNHPKYGTLSVKLDRSSVRGDVTKLVNFVVNMEEPTTQLQDIKSTCLTEQQVSSYVDSISKDLPTIGKLIDYLTRLGYNPQLIMDATQHNNERVIHICSPFTLCSTKYSYDSNVHAIHRFVVIDQHNRNVAVSIANTITDNNHITITNFADKYGWKRETCEAKDKWKWVNGGFHYELPFDKNDIPNTYCTLIHHIVEAEQNKVCSMQ